MADKKKVVWILGSGFSKPFGGPLLQDLISKQTLADIIHWPFDGTKAHGDLVELSALVLAIYDAGMQARLWEDAEQFLDRLEFASANNVPMAKQIRALRPLWSVVPDDRGSLSIRLQRILAKTDGLHMLHLAATRYVAAACTGFTLVAEKGFHTVADVWSPSFRWYMFLKPQDVVITFNYDRILDIIDEAARRVRTRTSDRTFELWSPMEKSFEAALNAGATAVCHMHGSVCWKTPAPGKAAIVIDRRRAVAHLHPERAVLGTPGIGKAQLSDGLLKPVWDHAVESIKNADAVVFVGYRFPPSDNTSKASLLGALKKNERAKVHCVLGPASRDVPRLRGMVGFTGKSLKDHEMYAEDFFAVFERDQLFH